MRSTMGGMAAVAAVVALATACGSSAPSSTSSYGYAQELALAQCLRGHGLPAFPNPRSSGGFSSSVLPTINTTKGQAAYTACKHLLTGAPSLSELQQDLQAEQAREAQMLPALLKFEQCVRSHGVPGFTIFGQSKPAGFNPDTPQLQSALRTCQHLLPPGAHVSISTNKS